MDVLKITDDEIITSETIDLRERIIKFVIYRINRMNNEIQTHSYRKCFENSRNDQGTRMSCAFTC